MQHLDESSLAVVPSDRDRVDAGKAGRAPDGARKGNDPTAANRGLDGTMAPLCRIVGETRFAVDACVARQGDPRDGLVALQAGVLRLTRSHGDGRRHITDFLYPGDLVGFGEPRAVWQVDVEAVTPARLCTLAPRRARGTGGRPDRLYRRLFDLARAQGLRAEAHALLLATPAPVDRLAAFLLDLRDRGGTAGPETPAKEAEAAGPQTIEIPMRRADIADYLGLTVETVSRSFSRLAEAGIIGLPHPKQILVLDPERLEAQAGGCGAAVEASLTGPSRPPHHRAPSTRG